MAWKNLSLKTRTGTIYAISGLIIGILVGLISNITLNRTGYIFYRSDINKNIFLNLVGFYSILVLPIIGAIIGLIISKIKSKRGRDELGE